MNKALVYVAIAIILGLATVLIPTSFFLVKADQYGRIVLLFSSTGKSIPPLLEYSEENHVGITSSKELEILGIGFVVASIVYVLFKRKIPEHDHGWPMRLY